MNRLMRYLPQKQSHFVAVVYLFFALATVSLFALDKYYLTPQFEAELTKITVHITKAACSYKLENSSGTNLGRFRSSGSPRAIDYMYWFEGQDNAGKIYQFHGLAFNWETHSLLRLAEGDLINIKFNGSTNQFVKLGEGSQLSGKGISTCTQRG